MGSFIAIRISVSRQMNSLSKNRQLPIYIVTAKKKTVAIVIAKINGTLYFSEHIPSEHLPKYFDLLLPSLVLTGGSAEAKKFCHLTFEVVCINFT